MFVVDQDFDIFYAAAKRDGLDLQSTDVGQAFIQGMASALGSDLAKTEAKKKFADFMKNPTSRFLVTNAKRDEWNTGKDSWKRLATHLCNIMDRSKEYTTGRWCESSRTDRNYAITEADWRAFISLFPCAARTQQAHGAFIAPFRRFMETRANRAKMLFLVHETEQAYRMDVQQSFCFANKELCVWCNQNQ